MKSDQLGDSVGTAKCVRRFDSRTFVFLLGMHCCSSRLTITTAVIKLFNIEERCPICR